jgi:hypothetical protein
VGASVFRTIRIRPTQAAFGTHFLTSDPTLRELRRLDSVRVYNEATRQPPCRACAPLQVCLSLVMGVREAPSAESAGVAGSLGADSRCSAGPATLHSPGRHVYVAARDGPMADSHEWLVRIGGERAAAN